MTVQELIDKLSEVVDKDQIIESEKELYSILSTPTDAELTTYGLIKRVKSWK